MTSAIPKRTRDARPELTGMEPPASVTDFPSELRLEDDLLQSLLESADYVDPASRLPARGNGALQLATPETIREAFVEAWETLSHALGIGIGATQALEGIRDLVLYDIPDGTRSTLSIPTQHDIELDAGMFCLALVHTLASLGARTSVMLTHTAYNRERGPEDTKRFLRMLASGIEPFRSYSRRHGMAIHLYGLRPGYELEGSFRNAFPVPRRVAFDAHFLLDYEEEWFLTPEGRAALALLPEVDVVLRHTKLQVSGGWIPIRMRRSAYLYCQNGTLHSNWTTDEYAALVATAHLAKVLHRGEALSKTYVSIDEIKDRFKRREIDLAQRVVRLKPDARKLFVVGSPIGLVQVYA